MRKPFFLLSFFSLTFGLIISRSSLTHFFDPISLIFVTGTALLLALGKHEFVEVKRMSDDVTDTISYGAYLGAALASLCALIHVFHSLADSTRLGDVLATCALSLFYALLVSAGMIMKSKKTPPSLLYPFSAILAVIGLTAVVYKL